MNSSKSSNSPVNIIIFGLCLVTGIIHFVQDDPILKLNAIGFIALGTAIAFNLSVFAQIKQNAPQMLAVYAFATIVLYFAVYREAGLSYTIGMVAKVVEGLLMILCSVAMARNSGNSVRRRFRSRPIWML